MREYILVPLDASVFAEQALDQASELASAMNATLHLVSIVPPPHVLPVHIHKVKELQALMGALQQAEIERRSNYLERKAESFNEQGIRVQIDVATGHPAEEILRFSTQDEQTLLVMSTHGRGGLRRILLGSVAMKVVQGTHIPVLLVRGKST